MLDFFPERIRCLIQTSLIKIRPQSNVDLNFIYFYFSFPLFTAVHKICTGQIPVKDFIDQIRHTKGHV